jgi:hypothetical protein
MSNAPDENLYAITMYADDDRKIVFYQFPIGPLTSVQHAIFLRDGKFRKDGTRECICCNGAIYVVHVQREWDNEKFPIIANPSKSAPGKKNITKADLDGDTEFNKAQTAWRLLRDDPLYREATEKAYQRREKIYLDARWLQELAVTIKINHPEPDTELLVDNPSAVLSETQKINNKQKTKRKSLPPLEELAKTLSFPKDEREDDDWILAKNIGVPKVSTLRTRRSEGEKYELEDESILGRDEQRRIWWQPIEDSQKVFYLRASLSQGKALSYVFSRQFMGRRMSLRLRRILSLGVLVYSPYSESRSLL